MKLFARLILIALFSGSFLVQDVNAQHKFELGIHLDPLILPVSTVTFIEKGPGYYDIDGSIKIAQAIGADFNYWPFKYFGISGGIRLRNFESNVEYVIPDPFHEEAAPLLEDSFPFRATGWGPAFAIHWRNNRWQASIGFSFYTLTHQEYESRSGFSAVSIWDEFGEKILDIKVDEEAFWPYPPITYDFLQVEARYYISKNLFLRFGFENSSTSYWNPVSLHIAGFIKDVIPQDKVLNDFKMKGHLTSFSVGVGGNLGFGKYKSR
jgi:hypothetical protein